MSLEAIAELVACATCARVAGSDGQVPRRCGWCDAASCTSCVDGAPDYRCGKCGIVPTKWGAAYFSAEIARAAGLACPCCKRVARPVFAEKSLRPWDIPHTPECPRNVARVLARARGGATDDMLRLAQLFELGVGVPRCDRTALQWYLAAAHRQVPIAQSKVGAMLWSGRGVPEPMTETALAWMDIAARAGCRIARHNVGLCFKHGAGVPHDEALAALWLGDAPPETLPPLRVLDPYGGPRPAPPVASAPPTPAAPTAVPSQE